MRARTQLKTFLYKSCPRCRGDLVLSSAEESWRESAASVEYACLQCGGQFTLRALLEARRAAPVESA
jgi:hypothetical protein